MRKVFAGLFSSVDGVVQAPKGPSGLTILRLAVCDRKDQVVGRRHRS
jgi:hypothetical protein